MTPQDLNKPIVPISYIHLTLQIAEEHGVAKDQLLAGVSFDRALLDEPSAYVGLMDYGRICIGSMVLSGDPSLGIEFGLRNNATLHGFWGFGVMSQPTLKEAMEFANYFSPIRMPGWRFTRREHGDTTIIDCNETIALGPLSQYGQDMILVGLFNSFRQFFPSEEGVTLCFENAKPDYFDRYADRLPECRFSTGGLSLRFPSSFLDTPIFSANAVTARLMARECEREIARLGRTQDLVSQVQDLLQDQKPNYPSLKNVAQSLFMSDRSLKRRLNLMGTSFREILNEQRKRDSAELLNTSTLSVDKIATTMGYSSAANFIRAFKCWTGQTPSQYRRH